MHCLNLVPRPFFLITLISLSRAYGCSTMAIIVSLLLISGEKNFNLFESVQYNSVILLFLCIYIYIYIYIYIVCTVGSATVYMFEVNDRVMATEGETVKFQCVFYGQGSIVWIIKGIHYIYSMDFPERHSLEGNNIIVVQFVDRSMNGSTYSCAAQSMISNVIQLTVQSMDNPINVGKRHPFHKVLISLIFDQQTL